MFDLDLSKMMLVGVVALVVVGPKELPAVLRALARALAGLRLFQSGLRKAVATFVADADLGSVDREFENLGKRMRDNIATNPATAMRGSLPSTAWTSGVKGEAEHEASQYVSPEMQAYLAPLPEEPALAEVEAAPRPSAMNAAKARRPATATATGRAR